MTTREVVLLTMFLVAFLILIATQELDQKLMARQSHCESVTIHNLDQRFVEQARIAAASRQQSLEQWMVESSVLESGYHLNSGFCKH